MDEDEDCRLHWTKEQIFKFIKLVRQHPQLWNSENKNFRNQFQRDLAYDTISYEMGVTNEAVKKKIHILRSQYIVEVKKMRANNTNQPVWPYFNAMKFFYEKDWDEANEIEDTADDTETFLMEVNDESEDSTKQTDTNEVSKYKWNRAKSLKLIEIYRAYPELYNSNCFDYRNKYKRKLALESVAQQMGTTTEIIKKKMHALRTMYTTEVKKMKKKNSAQPRWALFEALKFLYDEAYYTPRPKYNMGDVKIDYNDENALEDIIEYALEDDGKEAQYLDMDEGSCASSSNTYQIPNETQTTMEQQQKAPNCFSCKERDEFTTFGETVASELRLTKDHESIHKLLKQQILKAVEEAKELIAVLE